jgi:hypothetical protein
MPLLPISTAIRVTASIAAIGILIMSLEDVAMLRVFRKDGILSWEVLRLQDSWSVNGVTGKLANFFLDYPRFRVFIVARLVASIVLLLFLTNQVVFLISSFIILVSLLALTFRSIYGLDGAHQMYIIIFGALFLSALTAEESLGRIFSIWFVALQAGFAYFVSGAAKLISPMWRSGQALVGVFGTDVYGDRRAYALFSKYLGLACLLSWIVILFECGFCLIFLLDLRIGLLILVGGLCFHIIVALLMGLNGFVFAFVATYPCIVYCAQHASVWLASSI